MRKLFYSLHRRYYGYPCRDEVRLAIKLDLCNNSVKYRAAMFYVCGEPIGKVASLLGLSKERIKIVLNAVVRGIDYEG